MPARPRGGRPAAAGVPRGHRITVRLAPTELEPVTELAARLPPLRTGPNDSGALRSLAMQGAAIGPHHDRLAELAQLWGVPLADVVQAALGYALKPHRLEFWRPDSSGRGVDNPTPGA